MVKLINIVIMKKKNTPVFGLRAKTTTKPIKSMTPYVLSEDDHSTPIDLYSILLSERIVFLNGDIGDYNCELIKAQLLYLEGLDANKDITMYINSGGGSVYAGYGLIDTMEYIRPDIVTINTGLAASMAAVILSAGTKGKRKSLKRSRTMIHQPLSYSGYSQATDLEIETKQILLIKRELTEMIAENTGLDFNKVANDMERDYWMTAKETFEYGIIDEILIKRK